MSSLTKESVIKNVATFLLAIGRHGVPSGHLYALHCGELEIHQYEAVLGLMRQSGLVAEHTRHFLTLTDRGLGVMAEVEAAAAELVVKGGAL